MGSSLISYHILPPGVLGNLFSCFCVTLHCKHKPTKQTGVKTSSLGRVEVKTDRFTENQDHLEVTNEVVNVILSHLVQTHLQQHVDGCDSCERHVVDLLVVGLQDELAEGAVAVSVNLREVTQDKAEKFTDNNLQYFLGGKQFLEAASSHTHGLMSPYLRASMTSFRQSPMS